MPLPNLK
ncbi:uncharacterized protein FPRN_15251 [Fusarium proliferatum]|nr:uncharacterized protein FPRN_15251 [Fusarium proliferatum]